ncbi:MAG: fumarylacetoacetate hydrolase family protein [Actinomycetota bacterium]|nr:fumarylacetoacetate hydrolase family protein [Actinomycetota bacterium]
MKLATALIPTQALQVPPAGGSGYLQVAGEVVEDRLVALAGGVTVKDVLAGGSPTLGEASWPLSEVQLLAPVPDPGTVYAIGLNYARHIAETGDTPPPEPMVFVKVAGSVAPPGGPVRCPEVVRRLDYEGELTIVIGAGGRAAGYCVADDVTARDLQHREPQWTRAKGADTFCPFGPWVTTAEEVPDPEDLQLRTWVNGELRQDSSTSDLIFGCAELVEFISETCTLLPGDLILTGTPSGVGMGLDPPRFLASGDVVRIEIERLGAIEHRVVYRALSPAS